MGGRRGDGTPVRTRREDKGKGIAIEKRVTNFICWLYKLATACKQNVGGRGRGGWARRQGGKKKGGERGDKDKGKRVGGEITGCRTGGVRLGGRALKYARNSADAWHQEKKTPPLLPCPGG